MSTSAELRVSFDPELFGTTEDFKGNTVLWPNLKFTDGSMKLDSENIGRGIKNEARYIEMMEEHSGNQSNGGSSFWKLPDSATDTALSLELFATGKPVSQSMDKEIHEDDLLLLKELQRWTDKSFAPTQRVKVCATITALKDRFQVVGIETPTPDMKTRSLKAACVRLLDYFEDSGIWVIEEENDRFGDT